MGWVGKIFGVVPKEERDGIRLNREQPFWEVDGTKDAAAVFRALHDLLPEGSILYLEDGFPDKSIRAFFDRYAIPEQAHVALGTMWRSTNRIHVPATRETLTELATLAEHHAAPELAIHFHVYKDGKMLLEWYDGFFTDPMYLDSSLSESAIATFANALGVQYRRVEL